MGKLSYWERRYLKDKARSVNRAEDFIKSQQRLYQEAEKEIQKEIEKLYQKFANAQDITLTEAKQLIRGADFRQIDFDAMIQESLELMEKLKKKDQLPKDVVAAMERQHMMLEKKIAACTKRGEISYLELKSLEIDRKLISLYDQNQASIYDYLKNEWDDGYYRQVYNTQQHIGFGKDFVKPNDAAVSRAILNRYDKRNYSKSLYAHCTNFSKDLRENLVIGLIRGENLDKMAGRIQKRMGVAFSAAKTLVRTETAYVFEQSSMEAYKQCGIEWYEYLATLDSRTSEICQGLDGKHFKLKDAVPGKNYPPMHPNCRSTTVCWFPDEEKKKAATTRIAKDGRGKYYEVPADMTYKQWRKQHAPEEDLKDKADRLLDAMTDLRKPIGLGDLPYASRIMKTVHGNNTSAGKLVRTYFNQIQMINTKAEKAKYSPITGLIRYNARRSSMDARGKDAQLWHEVGHRIDHLTGNRSELKIFRDAIINDSETLFQNLITSGTCANMKEVYKYLRDKRKQEPLYGDIIDLLDGASGKRIILEGGHSAEYWERDYALEHETYAHFFSAMMVNAPEKIAAMEQVFPTAWKTFKEVLKSV